MKEIVLPINLSMEGIVTVYQTDIRNSRKTKISQHNLILDDYIHTVLEKGACMAEGTSLYWRNIFKCYLGTDNVAEESSQLGIQGTTLASTSESETVLSHTVENGSVRNSNLFTFEAGVGTGTIGELVLQADESSSTSGWDYNWISRIAFDPPIEKSDHTKLEIEWEIRVNFGDSMWSGSLQNAQIDGSSTDWVITINDDQKVRFTSYPSNNERAPLRRWFDIGGTGVFPAPRVLVGDSHNPTDISNDGHWELKGNLIADIVSTSVVENVPYSEGSSEREFSIYFGTDTANGDIGELIIGIDYDTGSLMRITFDPPLNKPDTHRLKITPKLSITRGGA